MTPRRRREIEPLPEIRCGEKTIFWPDVEACDAECFLPPDHEGDHEDQILGPWSSEDD